MPKLYTCKCGKRCRGERCRECYTKVATSTTRRCACGAKLESRTVGERCFACIRGIITETAATVPRVTPTPRETGDWMILPDPHIPFHCPETLHKLCRDALLLGITKLVVPGDLIHGDMLSKYIGAGRQVPITEELIRTGHVLNALSSIFSRIVITMGNHDQRVERTIARWAESKQGAIALDLVAAALGASNTDAESIASSIFGHFFGSPSVTIHNLPDIEINGRWLLLHPASARRISPQGERALAHKHRKSIICGHSHLFAVGFDDSGQDIAANIGHAADEAKWRYIREKPTSFPAMVRGYAALLCDPACPEGRLLPLADHPLWFDLAALRERLCPSE